MNPYQQQVLDAAGAQFDKSGLQAQNQVTQNAISAGAFGGSRTGVAQGVAASNIARDRDSAMAGVLAQGCGDAQQRAMQAAQFGFGAEQFADPQRRAGLLGSQMSGLPWGQVQTGQTPNYQNAASGFLGGALTAGSLFGGMK
jgi:hypothetical protein